jgi:uncharacterized membrane protein
MDDGSLIFLGFLCIILVLLGPIGFFLALGARARLKRVEAQLATLLLQPRAAAALDNGRSALDGLAEPAGLPPSTQSSPGHAEAIAPQPRAAPPFAAAPVAPDWAGEAPTPRPPPEVPNPDAFAPARKPGLEERLGARWAVVVGGIALALGALLLVKYSIDQGLFGPGARVIGGLLLGCGLVVAGEYLRRKEPREETPRPGAPVPSVLTGAGTVAAFGALYAAHALYGFIGPGVAFVLMGAVGVATMLAAALHGPALAGLGLIGALAAPLLVTSDNPNPWPVALYVAVVCAAAYGLARLRRWLWLAAGAAIGAAIWEGLFLLNLNGTNGLDFMLASFAHLVVETALCILVFALAPHWAVPPAEQQTDKVASEAMLGCAAVASLAFSATAVGAGVGPAWILAAALIVSMLALTGVRLPAVASASAAAGVVILAALASWNGSMGLLADPYAFFEKGSAPGDARLFISFGLIASLALCALCVWRLLNPQPLSFAKAAIYAGAGVLSPLGALSLLYLRLAVLQSDAALAATAAAVAAAMAVVAAVFLQRRTSDAPPAITLGLGAFAAGAIAGLLLGLVFELSEGTLTVALALAALGAAFVSERLVVPALRWCVLALGLAVAGRFLHEPRIVGDALGKTILFNWLLFGYGAPALAFGFAARLMRRSGEDAPVRVAQALSILCSFLLATFEIRHALNDGDPFSPLSSVVEQGLFVVVGILFSLVLMELDARRANPLYRYASLGFGALTLAQTLIGLLVWRNPYLFGDAVEGGAIFNSLILGYALPALAAFVFARRARVRPPEWRRVAASIVCMALVFAYLNLELRRLFHPSGEISFFYATSDGEFYAYSALWLTLGILLLAFGILARSKPARLASAAVVALTVVKVFLLDLAGLEGALRAFSFLGLGAALIGIGLVYQKFVFARPVPDAEAKTAVPTARM